ncbi:MAG: cell wall-binding repeat-containing protein [Gracilibacteraceae bacterium]|jgi:hypothetical protein|nr:cell wall-binding repeat-containing protein [Gracilibacteraceae bacterium]
MIRHSKAQRLLSVLLALFLTLLLPGDIVAPASALAAEIPAGSNTYGYITGVTINISVAVPESIPGFVFDPEITEYDIVLAETNNAFQLSFDTADPRPDNFYYKLLIDGELNAGTNYEKEITDSTTKMATLAGTKIHSTSKIGETHTFSLVVGQKYDGIYVNSDVYNFNVTRIPALKTPSGFAVKNSANVSLTLTPPFKGGTTDYVRSYSAVTTDSVIKLTAQGAAADVKTYIGETLIAPTDYEITLADYTAPDSDIAVIPFSLRYDAEGKIPSRSDYTLYVSGTDYSPLITEQPQDINCDKEETPILSVTVTEPSDGTLSYQWMRFGQSVPIAGATEPTYQPPTKWSGELSYYCVITNTVDGVAFQTTSARAKVTVNGGDITPPEILLQPGTFSMKGTTLRDYKTEYMAGERFDKISVVAYTQERGITISAEWFYSAAPSAEAAVSLGVTSAKANIGFGSDGYLSVYTPSEGLPAGKHYIFCVVTATDDKDPENRASATSEMAELTYSAYGDTLGLSGSGSEDDPYLVSSAEDFAKIRDAVAGWQKLSGQYFQMTGDVTLPADWEPIGFVGEKNEYGVSTRRFAGILDGGGHTLTVAPDGKPLFAYVSDAVIRNLNIFGERINGNGLIDGVSVDYGDDNNYWTGCPAGPTLENIRLLSGSRTRGSGLLTGSGSGLNTITIRGCVIEAGVVVGYSKAMSNVGSFVGGAFNGRMVNCVSYATVYGKNEIGGLAGSKGQSMGMCEFTNCAFLGEIIATGDRVGGIIGSGYDDLSAPGTPRVSIRNCYVAADITGGDRVGGLFGSEGGARASNVEGAGTEADISDNYFYGAITASGANSGGIIGYYRSVNPNVRVENNYYYESSEDVSVGIGNADDIEGDDDLAAAAEAACTLKPAEEFADGTVLALLNAGVYANWTQGEKYPVLLEGAVLTDLEVSGDYKDLYYIGEELDLTGIAYTAVWSNGYRETVSPGDVTVSGYDNTVRGFQTLTLTYGAASAEIMVTVLRPEGQIDVSFTLLGNALHDSEEDGVVNTLSGGGLEIWIGARNYTVSNNATVLDVLEGALTEASLTWYNPEGNYIKSITKDGVTIGEFTNGPNSGWMYTLNGERSLLGVAQQFLDDGDVIIFHYTDDWELEDGSEWLGGGAEEPDVPGVIGIPAEDIAVDEETGAAVAEVGINNIETAVSAALEAAEGNGTESAVEIRVTDIPNIPDEAVTKVTVNLPAGAASSLQKVGAVTILTPAGDLTLDQKALEALAGDEDTGLSVVIAQADEAPLPEELAETAQEPRLYDLSVYRLADDTVAVHHFNGGRLTISLPYHYEFKSGETAAGVRVWYVEPDDSLTLIDDSDYDPSTEKVTFTIEHLSQFAVGYAAPKQDPVEPDPGEPDPEDPVIPKRPTPNGGSAVSNVTPPVTPADPAAPITVSRATLSYISGADRVLTSVAISRQGWESADTVILAPGGQNNLIDALAVAPLAGQEDAPILLSTGSLDPAVIAEIQRLGAKKVYAVGALSRAVIEALEAALPGLTVETLRGASRFETAALIGAKLSEPQGTFVVGYNAVADAVSVASYAAAHGYLIQIAGPDGTVGLAAGTPAAGAPVYILGGPALVRDIPGATRLYGATRYETNKAIRDALPFEYANIYTADGGTLVDALTGSALAAKSGAAIVLTPGNDPAGVDFGGITADTKVYAFGSAK